MSKIRTIKPDLFRHEKLFEVEKTYQLPLRIAFIGLFTCCDREGRFRWRPKQLKLDVLPYDEFDFEHALIALHVTGFIEKYAKDGEYYGYIPSWRKHQRINTREPESNLPDPDQCVHVQAPVLQTSAYVEVEMEMEMEEELEVEKEVEVEVSNVTSVQTPPPPLPSRTNESPDVLTIFEHWKTTMQHLNAKLDDKRKKIIRNALKSGYTVNQLCEAITGCSYTPHNIGDNDRGQRYDGLHVILRDADQIDRFIKNCHKPPRPPNPADKLLQANINAGQSWLNKKQTEVNSNGNA